LHLGVYARNFRDRVYANASQVMRTALRLLEMEDREFAEKLAALWVAISEWDASPDAEEGVLERLYAWVDELVTGKAEGIA
jgi:Arc/MetJ-type ribon-helix-helix transcriptional regulator